MKQLLLAAVMLIAFDGLLPAHADSPLTSTSFSQNYIDEPIVQLASDKQLLTAEITEYLLDDLNPMDVKAAVVNALSWDAPNKLAPQFWSALARKHEVAPRRLSEKLLTTDEKALLAYMRSLDDYGTPEKQYDLFKQAEQEAPLSFTIALLASLNRSQHRFDNNWCAVFKEVSDTITREDLTQDRMRKEGIETVMEYMNLYQEYCYSE